MRQPVRASVGDVVPTRSDRAVPRKRGRPKGVKALVRDPFPPLVPGQVTSLEEFRARLSHFTGSADDAVSQIASALYRRGLTHVRQVAEDDYANFLADLT